MYMKKNLENLINSKNITIRINQPTIISTKEEVTSLYEL